MAKKKAAAKKKSAAKPAAKPAAPKAIKTALNRAGLVAHISDASGVAPRDVRAVLGASKARSPVRSARRARAASPCRAC